MHWVTTVRTSFHKTYSIVKLNCFLIYFGKSTFYALLMQNKCITLIMNVSDLHSCFVVPILLALKTVLPFGSLLAVFQHRSSSKFRRHLSADCQCLSERHRTVFHDVYIATVKVIAYMQIWTAKSHLEYKVMMKNPLWMKLKKKP